MTTANIRAGFCAVCGKGCASVNGAAWAHHVEPAPPHEAAPRPETVEYIVTPAEGRAL
jgi:hypothetical protein